jgi:predicted nucleotidyltransferase
MDRVVVTKNIEIPQAEIADFCRRNRIRRLSLFGSVLRADFRADSDVDMLVEFDPDHIPGLITLAGMELELSELLGGRRIDLRTAGDLSPYFRDEVVASAQLQYAAE